MSFRGVVALVAALGVFSFAATDSALGQFHGISIAKGCLGPVCEDELTSCEFNFGYNDGNGDTLRLHGAWDVQDVTGDGVRLPSQGDEVIGDTFSDGSMIGNDDGVCDPGEVCEGNLPIVAAAGNTTCTVGGALPCVIGPGGSNLNGLPGDPQPGLVTFRQDTYVVEADDPNPVVDQANVQWEDLCDDPNTSNCGVAVLNVAQAPGSTPVTRCDDEDLCTTDTCSEGVCTFTPDCAEDVDCDDEDVCTADSCVEGCCRNVPECSGAGTCGDGNECTADLCTQAGCCLHIPDCDVDSDCNDDDACTTDTCGEDGCCVNTPLCSSDEGCDDGDACTTDTCGADGCCTHDPIRCNDDDECTEDACDEATGCTFTPIEPPPAGCGSGAGCTPGFWKQSQHLQYWVTYRPEDLFDDVFGVTSSHGLNLLKTMQQGGGGEKALGRHVVAALLNAATKEVAFGFSEAEVIALVQQAYASGDFSGIKDSLEEQNELGCTVDKSGGRGGRPQSSKSIRG